MLTQNEINLDIEKRLIRLEKRTERYCSFCHLSEKTVDVLVVDGPYGICNACLDLCNQIVAERKKRKEP